MRNNPPQSLKELCSLAHRPLGRPFGLGSAGWFWSRLRSVTWLPWSEGLTASGLGWLHSCSGGWCRAPLGLSLRVTACSRRPAWASVYGSIRMPGGREQEPQASGFPLSLSAGLGKRKAAQVQRGGEDVIPSFHEFNSHRDQIDRLEFVSRRLRAGSCPEQNSQPQQPLQGEYKGKSYVLFG